MQVESGRAETEAKEESKIEKNLIEKMLKNLQSEWIDRVALICSWAWDCWELFYVLISSNFFINEYLSLDLHWKRICVGIRSNFKESSSWSTKLYMQETLRMKIISATLVETSKNI